MLDNHNRNINYLRLSVTDRCNLRCRYCMPKEGMSLLGHNDILRYEEILRVVRGAVKLGIEKVRITGGEPLVRKGLIEFVGILSRIEGLRDISLTTNGILLEDCAERLYRAGIRRINVSLDSLNAERYAYITRGGSMAAVLRGIDRAREVGFSPIKINVVAMKGFNDDELLDFAALTLEHPYDVRFIELMPFSEPGRDSFGGYLSCGDIQKTLEARFILNPLDDRKDRTMGPARMCRIEGARGRIGFISPMSHHFCHECNRLRLTADGNLRTCLFSDVETGLKALLRQGCGDDAIEAALIDAVRNKPKEHNLLQGGAAPRSCARSMQAIGG